MSNTVATAYDDVLYSSYAFSQTHPDRLATLATLFGMTPPPITHCRVLELGCGDGSNLIPMACTLPNSEFVGLDLAARPIVKGQATVETLSLQNITLRQGDVMEVAPDWGQFDYIIAHGLYSWVPANVQEQILAVCHDRLTANGVAYVSYNTYPGGHLRQMVRELMRFHTRHITDPTQQITQARAILRFTADAQPDTEAYGAFLRAELKRVTEGEDGYVYHDDLAEINSPVYFHEFAKRAANVGLQYLAEADFFEMQDHMFPPQMAETLRQLASKDIILKEQYADFLKCRKFRQTLLCRQPVLPHRTLVPERLTNLYVASAAQPATPEIDLREPSVAEFRSERGQALATNHPLMKAAMLCLAQSWPRPIGFTELLGQAYAQLGEGGHKHMGSRAEDLALLGNMVFQAYGKNLVELHVHVPHFVLEVSERPIASALARLQIRQSAFVTNVLHGSVKIEDLLGRHLLSLLDGTRDRNALVAELEALVRSGAATVQKDGVVMENPREIHQLLADGMEEKLRELARLALLVG